MTLHAPARSAASLLLLLSGTYGASACAPPREATAPHSAEAGLPSLPRAASSASARDAAIATMQSCAEPVRAGARDEGITAFLEGRAGVALERFGAAIQNDPRDRASEAFASASRAKLAEAHARAAEQQVSLPQIMLEPVPLVHSLRHAVEGLPSSKVHLEKESEAKNLITDSEDWHVKNGLTGGQWSARETTPPTVPPTFVGAGLTKTIVHSDHVAAIYDDIVVVSSEGKRPLVFNARAAMDRAPSRLRVEFAQLVGSTLVVELSYNGYAINSGGKNGFFAAYDARTGKLSWASDPLVSNAGDAVVSGGSIVTGYGFTAEPDFLFVLELATGKVDQKIPVKSGPEAIRPKGDRLFVRTYDVDYVFKSTTGIAPALAAALTPEDRGAPPTSEPETACWVRRAAASISSRDLHGLQDAVAALKPRSRDPVLFRLLQEEERKLTTPSGVDLTVASLVSVDTPPWQATPASAALARTTPKLVKVSTNAASPVRNMHPTFDPNAPFFIAPVDQGKLPNGAPTNIPSRYGMEDLRAIIPDQQKGPSSKVLVYGGRYVALVHDDTAERVFDLESFRHPPKANPQWKQFPIQDATYAQERDGVLYVCNGGGSYAKEVFGKKGFLSAIEVTSGKLLWRSAPLTCNATFAVVGEYLVSGYGFTDEPDFVFLVRRSDGAITQKIPVDSGPETITAIGNRIHVEAYKSVTELDLR